MQRHHHKLEVLLSDMECRYGIDHPISADIRAAIPKVTEPTFGAVKVIRAKGKSDSPSPFQWKSTQPVSAQ